MRTFEFAFLAECGTPLQVGVVEAENLLDAVREIGVHMDADPDAIRVVIKELPDA